MLGLENFLKTYLKDKKTLISLLKTNLSQVDTETLIDVIKVLNDELKLRIEEFEIKKGE